MHSLFNKCIHEFHAGLYGGGLANLAAIVDLEIKKREATTSAAKLVARALITCKSISNKMILFDII